MPSTSPTTTPRSSEQRSISARGDTCVNCVPLYSAVLGPLVVLCTPAAPNTQLARVLPPLGSLVRIDEETLPPAVARLLLAVSSASSHRWLLTGRLPALHLPLLRRPPGRARVHRKELSPVSDRPSNASPSHASRACELRHAFFDCSSLRRLTFPAHNSTLPQLQNLGYQAFGGCSSLATATLPLDADANVRAPSPLPSPPRPAQPRPLHPCCLERTAVPLLPRTSTARRRW